VLQSLRARARAGLGLRDGLLLQLLHYSWGDSIEYPQRSLIIGVECVCVDFHLWTELDTFFELHFRFLPLT
jgi:hypothetical protein